MGSQVRTIAMTMAMVPHGVLPGQLAAPTNFDDITDICCIGATQSSVMHMAVIAERYPRLNVVVTDFNQQLIDRWNNHLIEYEEQGLGQILQYLLHANLRLVGNVNDAIRAAQMIFIGVEVPIKLIGQRTGFDLGPWSKAVRRVVKEAHTPKIIVERSTMPIDSSDMTITLLAQRPGNLNDVQFVVLSNPDFSSPGNRLGDLRNPDMIVIGLKSNVGTALPLQQMYMGFDRNPLNQPNPPAIHIIQRHSAVNVDIAKLATNAMLTMKLTYINAISSLCDQTRGGDINIVRQILGEDYRLDNNYMTPTLGIGGPELIKDTTYMKHAFAEAGLHKQAKLTENVLQLDKERRAEFVQLMIEKMHSLRRRRIAILGVTYKSGVLDLTRSPAISICKALRRERAFLRIYEPLVAHPTIQQELGNPLGQLVVNYFDNVLEACTNAHAVVFMVPMPLLQQLTLQHFQVIFNVMRDRPGGRFLFTGWDLNINLDLLRQMGFQVYASGKH